MITWDKYYRPCVTGTQPYAVESHSQLTLSPHHPRNGSRGNYLTFPLNRFSGSTHLPGKPALWGQSALPLLSHPLSLFPARTPPRPPYLSSVPKVPWPLEVALGLFSVERTALQVSTPSLAHSDQGSPGRAGLAGEGGAQHST